MSIWRAINSPTNGDAKRTAPVLVRCRTATPWFDRLCELLALRTHLCDPENVTGSEFLRKLQRLARRRAVRFQYEPGLGKGSHGRVWLDTVSTTLKYPKKELGTGLLRAMCRDLRIEPRDL